MAKKEFSYCGKSLEELKGLSIKELADLLPSRQRRKIKRGFTDQEKVLLDKVKAGEKDIKTHCRDMIILPVMVGLSFKVHNGKEFSLVIVQPEMIGHYFGEFAVTRKKLMHNAPGIGATKSSAALSVK